MFGFSLQKLLVLAAIVAAVWYGFQWLSRLDRQRKAEREFSAFNFEHATTGILFRHFEDAEAECAHILAQARRLPLPAYDQCLKASHVFNLLDARGVISVTERQAYIGRVRALAKGCCEAWLETQLADGAEHG